MGSLHKRLEELEAELEEPTYEDWPHNEQLRDVAEILRSHRWGRSVYPATDREINLLGIGAAWEELRGSGEWVAPFSGAVLTLTDCGDGTFTAARSGDVVVEDLPEHIRRYVRRMDPEKQAKRDRWLYEHRGSFDIAAYGGPR